MRRLFVGGLLLWMLLTACGGAEEPGSLALRQTADLEERVAALESQIAALQETSADAHGEAMAGGFDVAMAQFVMDMAGFHGMDEALNETMTVDAAYIRTVTQVRKIVAQTAWPAELHEQAGAFVETLEAFAAALEADDGEQAATLAAEAHDIQHDFSAAIDGWLGEGGDHGHGN